MNKKLLLIILLAVLTVAVSNGQPVQKQFIKASSNYYWGEAVSVNEKEASDAALAQLTNSIAVKVSSQFSKTTTETEKRFNENVENILQTYSMATLKNVKSIRTPIDGNIEVFHYIEKGEVEKIFDQRRSLIKSLFNNAENCQLNGDFTSALKYFYFSLVLINSIPDQNVIADNLNLVTEIPNRINAIANNITIALKEEIKNADDEKTLVFSVKAFGKPVSALDLIFWDGSNQVNVSAKDGESLVKLFGSSVHFKELKFSVKYSYYESRDEIREVGDLWNLVAKPSFTSNIEVPLVKKEQKEQVKKTKTQEYEKEVNNSIQVTDSDIKLNIQTNTDCAVLEKISQSAITVIDLISKRKTKELNKLLDKDEFIKNKLTDMINLNGLSVLGNEFDVNVNKTFNGWEMRKITASSNYSSINTMSKEYLVLDFDSSGNFYDVNFGIIENLYNEFVEQGKFGNDWGNRQVIIKFLEKYRTGYMSRNLTMIEDMFADEAVIIVGRVLSKNKYKDVSKFLNQLPDAQYTRQTKEQYLKSLKGLFKSQKDIYLDFSNFSITKKNKQPGVYGVSMRQQYKSTTYADEGYLFLFVDFNEELPQIYVRSWQPQEWDDSSLIKLSNFILNK